MPMRHRTERLKMDTLNDGASSVEVIDEGFVWHEASRFNTKLANPHEYRGLWHYVSHRGPTVEDKNFIHSWIAARTTDSD